MKVKEELINRAIYSSIIGAISVILALLFYTLALKVSGVAKENQTYNRYISCVLSIPALERDAAKIDRCWTTVQEDTGVEVKRYDK